ncbi:MAG: DUF1588 domain-containing protein [Rhodobacterales bacterium]|nr:DUF1588 domain-containing protein [Rhodobacterales bacterium]
MNVRAHWILAALCAGELTLSGCGKDQAIEDVDGIQDPQIEHLSSTDRLLRVSMAVRGIRPSVADLDRVHDDPRAIDDLVDTYLASYEFGETVRDLHAELYLVRADTTFQLPVQGVLEDLEYDQIDLHESTVEAPLRLVEDVIMNDRPYTEIVTGQYAYADRVVSEIYGLPYDADGETWQKTVWTDGRPHAGVLSDSEMWRRHVSNAQNFHRGRANFVSNTFLCEDIADRDVVVLGGVDLSDPAEVADAVMSQESCTGCHQVIDPIAAVFWGYKEQLGRGAINEAYRVGCEWDWSKGEPPRGSYRIDHWCYPLRFYVVSDENLWDEWGLRPPGLFGEPARNMTELGELIARDNRFAQCTARTFYGYLGQMERMAVPFDVASDYQTTLTQNDFNIKAMVREMVMSEEFATIRVLQDPKAEVFYPGMQVIRPEQYSRTLFDLTGFRWLANQDQSGCAAGGNNCWLSVDLLNTDLYGFRSMQGGVDGYTVTSPIHTPTPTKALAMGMASDEAAGFVVEFDFSMPVTERHLLQLVEPETSDEAAIRSQLVWLHKRILGEFVGVDSQSVNLSYGLWETVYDREQNSSSA